MKCDWQEKSHQGAGGMLLMQRNCGRKQRLKRQVSGVERIRDQRGKGSLHLRKALSWMESKLQARAHL